MKYEVQVFDTWGRRIATYDDVPLMRVTRSMADTSDRVRGILPGRVEDLGHGYRVRILVDGALFLDALVTRVAPQWSDTRKLILDRFVRFHEVIEFDAERPALDGNAVVSRAFINRPVHEAVKALINSAPGDLHYAVNHTAYPEGAQRELAKFQARQLPGNELETGGIGQGNWVDGSRIDATNAVAKDGDTIGGLVVDGIAWPDLRLMMIEAEETTRNTQAAVLHGEVATWSDAQYAASGYRLSADAATVFLQSLIDAKGIDAIELNAHRDAQGIFDGRVDALGRYVGLVFGSDECFNAAMVENGHAAVSLPGNGTLLVPDHELKDFFSYSDVHVDGIAPTTGTVEALDISSGVYEAITALAYIAGGFIWSVETDLALTFRPANRADAVVFFNRRDHAVALGSDSSGITNRIALTGNPVTSAFSSLHTNAASIAEYGEREEVLEYVSTSTAVDGTKLANGLLDDIAYPNPGGEIEFLQGNGVVRPGDLVEARGSDVRRLEREVAGEWGDRFTGRLIGRVKTVTHEFRGRIVNTTAGLMAPLRSVENPLRFIVQGQPRAETLFQFRLDDDTVGLDLGYHLD